MKRSLLSLLLVALPATSAFAQDTKPQEGARMHGRIAPMRDRGVMIHGFAQTRAEFMPGDDQGFGLGTVRIGAAGRIAPGFNVRIEYDLLDSTLRDAVMTRTLGDVAIDIGSFRATFGDEGSRQDQDLDFITRSRVVTAFAPDYQVGAQVRGKLAEKKIAYAVGVYNGEGLLERDADGKALFTGRIGYTPVKGIDLGVSHSRMDEQKRLGGDLRITAGALELSGEGMLERLEGGKDPYGFQTTAAFKFDARHRALLRFDSFAADGEKSVRDLIVGLNCEPVKGVKLQSNFVAPIDDDTRENRLVVQAQFAF